MTDAGLIKVLGTNEVVRYAGVSVLSSDLSGKNLRCRVWLWNKIPQRPIQLLTRAQDKMIWSARQDAQELKQMFSSIWYITEQNKRWIMSTKHNEVMKSTKDFTDAINKKYTVFHLKLKGLASAYPLSSYFLQSHFTGTTESEQMQQMAKHRN